MAATATASHSSCRLLDLPDELLTRCLPNCGQCWATCKALLCKHLSGTAAGSLGLCLNVQQWKVHEQRASLLLLLESFPALQKVKLHVGQGSQAYLLSSLLSSPTTQGPAWLANLVDVTISKASNSGCNPFEFFIPTCVAKACPRLQRLVLQHITCRQPWQQHWQPASLPHLHELVVDQCDIHVQETDAHLQLQACPNLQRLQLITNGPQDLRCFSSKVTELVWVGHSVTFRWNQPISCPCLRKIRAPDAFIYDHELSSFPKYMPSLRELEIGQPRLDKPCGIDWSHLAFISMCASVSTCDIRSLSHLLSSTAQPPKLFFRGTRTGVEHQASLHRSAEEDLRDTSVLVSALQRAGGIKHQGTGTVQVKFFFPKQPHVQQMFQSLIPVFNDVQHVILAGRVQVNKTLLAAVGQLPKCTRLTLDDLWHGNIICYDNGIWDVMTSLLTNVAELELLTSALTAA